MQQPGGYPYRLGLERYAELQLLDFSTPATLSGEPLDQVRFWLQAALIWMYNFNHEESIECFRNALEIEPALPMAHWGISCCNAPNYNMEIMNKNTFPSAVEAERHAQLALALATTHPYISEVELELIQALQYRFPTTFELPDDLPVKQNTEAYAKQLQEVYQNHQSNPCVACLYAESLMSFAPWKLWDLNSGEPLGRTIEIVQILQAALSSAPLHPGLNHFLIHVMEMSPTPQLALTACGILRSICPDAGHLVHMPSHIYVLLGMWDEAVKANQEAQKADEIYVQRRGVHNAYTGYRIHNIHFIAYAAMFAGQYHVAVEAGNALRATLPSSLIEDTYLAQFFESFYSIDIHVDVRFGKWDKILARPVPPDPHIWPYTTVVWHYSRGIAFAVTGRIAEAEEEQERFVGSVLNLPPTWCLHNNLCINISQVGISMLQGEIAYRKGEYATAYDFLREAVRKSDELNYDEPWGWMQPPLHALGALLLEQNHVKDAELCFRKDMDTANYGRCHPNNIWSLSGLLSCLHKAKLNQSTFVDNLSSIEHEIDIYSKTFNALQMKADTNVNVACLCAHSLSSNGCCNILHAKE